MFIYTGNATESDKLIKKSPGLWPTGVLEPSSVPAGQLSVPTFPTFHSPTGLFPRASCQHALSRAWLAWDTGRLKRVGAWFHTCRRPFGQFFSSFLPSGAPSKFHDFLHPSKLPTSQPKWTTSQPKVDFGTKLPGYLEPF